MISVERLQTYSPEDATGIGRLRPFLKDNGTDEPVDDQILRRIIDSPDRDQLVARDVNQNRIIGAATLNIIVGSIAGRKGWLEDFVTDPTTGIKGSVS